MADIEEKSRPRKYKRCSECGLDIRCGNRERHEAGYHHNQRLETIRQDAIIAKRKAS